MLRDLKYVGVNSSRIWVTVHVGDEYKIPESVINKALMIAMNYLIENMDIGKQKEPE